MAAAIRVVLVSKGGMTTMSRHSVVLTSLQPLLCQVGWAHTLERAT